ncbi:DNA polymerase III subunit delta [Leptolyngbya iicbica]|uniref:DNA polymerase III subunit delta n=2 Tax=Cyanophyceae TaxID=3028117 RepID=A0A4Q7EF88_9CYAN|nr:DNA polymerase III subunit delta [Leptolyngbya sp. LK]RZM81717.1 DNA polymerase III subunit delta [Leptolyngbya sp. LK]
MAVYYFWGDDDFQMNQAIAQLRERAIDDAWASFNYDKIGSDVAEGPTIALNQAMTPPFGTGKRFVWLVDTPLGQRCSEALRLEFERTLPKVPDTSILLLSSQQKPDGRSKFTKLLQKHGEIREFGTIPPWKSDQIVRQIEQTAKAQGLTLTSDAVDLLVDAVGNQTRQLMLELEKLSLYWGDRPGPIDAAAVSQLVTVSTQSSLQLAAALREGNTDRALSLLADLLNRNEAPLRIVSTLVGQFRTWLWVKLMADSGERNPQTIAKAAEIGNPKRVYFLQKEVAMLSLSGLQQVLEHLLALEAGLKSGQDATALLQTKVVEIAQICQNPRQISARVR